MSKNKQNSGNRKAAALGLLLGCCVLLAACAQGESSLPEESESSSSQSSSTVGMSRSASPVSSGTQAEAGGSGASPSVPPVNRAPEVDDSNPITTGEGEPEEGMSAEFWAEPVYWCGQDRIPLYLKNTGSEPIQLGRDFVLESLDDKGKWAVLKPQDEEPAQLDNPGVQFPIESGEVRTIWAYLGGAGKVENGAVRMPDGEINYRLTITLPDGTEKTAEFRFDQQMPEHDEYSVRMEQAVYPVGTEKAVMKMTNNTGEESGFGMEYSLERLEEGVWKYFPPKSEVYFIAIAQIFPAGETTDFTVSLGEYELVPGRYRVVKQLDSWYYAAEFEVK